MTDALIGDLAKIGGLHVISRTSSMHYKGTKKSLPEIAREIKVDAVVEGTVQRSGDRVVDSRAIDPRRHRPAPVGARLRTRDARRAGSAE